MHIVKNGILQRFAFCVGNYASANLALVAVEHSHYNSLASRSRQRAQISAAKRSRRSRCMFLSLPPTKVSSTSTPPLSGPPSFVPNVPVLRASLRRCSMNHAVFWETPRCAVNLPRANTVLAANQHPQGGEPLLQRDWRILEDGFDLDGELATAGRGTSTASES